jgi:hypothetical protein
VLATAEFKARLVQEVFRDLILTLPPDVIAHIRDLTALAQDRRETD